MDDEDGRYPTDEVPEVDDAMGNNRQASGDDVQDPTADDRPDYGPDDGRDDELGDGPDDGLDDRPDDPQELEMLAYIMFVPFVIFFYITLLGITIYWRLVAINLTSSSSTSLTNLTRQRQPDLSRPNYPPLCYRVFSPSCCFEFTVVKRKSKHAASLHPGRDSLRYFISSHHHLVTMNFEFPRDFRPPTLVYSHTQQKEIMVLIRARIEHHLRSTNDPHTQFAIQTDPFYFVIPVQDSIAQSLAIEASTLTAPELYEALLWMRTDEAPQTLKDNDMLRGVLGGNEAMLDATVLKVIMVYQTQYPEARRPRLVADMALVHDSLDGDIDLLTFGLGVVLRVKVQTDKLHNDAGEPAPCELPQTVSHKSVGTKVLANDEIAEPSNLSKALLVFRPDRLTYFLLPPQLCHSINIPLEERTAPPSNMFPSLPTTVLMIALAIPGTIAKSPPASGFQAYYRATKLYHTANVTIAKAPYAVMNAQVIDIIIDGSPPYMSSDQFLEDMKLAARIMGGNLAKIGDVADIMGDILNNQATEDEPSVTYTVDLSAAAFSNDASPGQTIEDAMKLASTATSPFSGFKGFVFWLFAAPSRLFWGIVLFGVFNVLNFVGIGLCCAIFFDIPSEKEAETPVSAKERSTEAPELEMQEEGVSLLRPTSFEGSAAPGSSTEAPELEMQEEGVSLLRPTSFEGSAAPGSSTEEPDLEMQDGGSLLRPASFEGPAAPETREH
ncbi:hypothetical protein GE09DRAFT_1195760 [Coniochaeta sp. 2T2.1]|nr:hypothetical protein GE09DRAFT_1195760 [Coniochaeta sp. 2T2.1]